MTARPMPQAGDSMSSSSAGSVVPRALMRVALR